MSRSTPFLLIPGLACTPRLYERQIPALWRLGAVMVANHTAADTMAGIAEAVLAHAPPQFNLIGLSMGGYVAFEILRRAPERVAKLALLDSAARADLPEQAERRRQLIAMAEEGKLIEINDVLWPLLVHVSRKEDRPLREIVEEMMLATGAGGFIRQQRALLGRPDSRPALASIQCPTLVIVGDGDRLTPPKVNEEIVHGIPGARLEVVRECGHLSSLEQPDPVTKLLVDWFGS